ncbi:MAG: hypothetical protein NTY80_03260 [candidate division SR1 bacterium]|nr:hypothetical protein [candidate division SR1 bacterium]
MFFVLYFWRKYRSNKSLVAQLYHFDEQSQHISKQVLGQKIHKTSGKTKLILFIEYLEKFTTTTPYTDIRGLLSIQGFAHQDIQDLQRVLYADEKLSTNLENKINERIVSNSKF